MSQPVVAIAQRPPVLLDLAASLERAVQCVGDAAAAGPEAAADGVLFNGGSSVIGPEGEWIVEPVYGRAELITATLDMKAIDRAHQDLDVTGHYARDDIFELRVDARRRRGGVISSAD